MTLREVLITADLDKVYRIINEKDNNNFAPVDNPTLLQTVDNYSRVVKELLEKPKARKYSMPIVAKYTVDPIDKTKYVDVCLHNPRYVAPPKGAKPWGGKRGGGKRGVKIPKGKYNCNADKYNQYFSFMGVRWSKLIDTPMEIESKSISIEEAIAALLWELTFDGWTEEKAAANTDIIIERLKEAEKEIKEGKCIELPPKKKGGFKVVIPDMVSKQILDIANKYNEPKKCGTCWGHGLWPDGTAPMGPIDASDGMPTMACPECGANPNPSIYKS